MNCAQTEKGHNINSRWMDHALRNIALPIQRVCIFEWLTITLANDQPDAHILMHLLQSSTCTCFEQYLAHPQEVKL
jgi:hypothetical protein